MLQEKAAYLNVNIPTVVVYFLVAIVGSILLVIIGWKLYAYWRDNRVNQAMQREIYEQEKAVLITLYNALDGKNWFNKARWCSSEPINRWHGVKMDPKTHRVNKLILPENRLTGKRPCAL